jgi:hypothetical protein
MQCQFIKEDGSQCGAMAMKEATFCFSHNPDTQEEKQLAVQKGGFASKKTDMNLIPVDIKTPQQVAALLEDTINRVRNGEIPPNIANTIGYLAGHMLKALEVSEMDQRVEMIESVLFQRKVATKGKNFR